MARGKTISLNARVDTDVDVDLTLRELAAQLSGEDVAELMKLVPPKIMPGKGDPPPNRWIEDAHRYAIAHGDTPQIFKDLLWHVHGRATA